MNKAGIADRLTARTGLGKSVAKEAVDGEFAVIGDALADGEEVRITGFGTFGTRNRPARTGRNEIYTTRNADRRQQSEFTTAS